MDQSTSRNPLVNVNYIIVCIVGQKKLLKSKFRFLCSYLMFEQKLKCILIENSVCNKKNV